MKKTWYFLPPGAMLVFALIAIICSILIGVFTKLHVQGTAAKVGYTLAMFTVIWLFLSWVIKQIVFVRLRRMVPERIKEIESIDETRYFPAILNFLTLFPKEKMRALLVDDLNMHEIIKERDALQHTIYGGLLVGTIGFIICLILFRSN